MINMWHDYFQNLYNSVQDNGNRKMYVNKFSLLQDSFITDCVTVMEVADANIRQKKSAGPNGLAMETFLELRF